MLKQVDRLIIKELIPFWFFGVAVFTLLIMAGTYLFKLTEYLVKGVDSSIIFQLAGLYLPGIVVKTFPMAFLLSTLLGFGRLSGDSEIVVLKSSGISFFRVVRPVFCFGLVIGLATFLINDLVVPSASIKATDMALDILTKTSANGSRPQHYPLYKGGRLIAVIHAKDFNFDQKLLSGVSIIVYKPNGKVGYYMHAKQMVFKDVGLDLFSLDGSGWELTKGCRVISADGKIHFKVKERVWPYQIPKVTFTPTDILSHRLTDLDSLSVKQIRIQIERAKKDPNFDIGQRVNLEFGFWNKLAMPFTAVIFGLLGASLGTRGHRSNMASGFWISIVIIFSYMTLANFMALYAKNQAIVPFVASFTPLLLGLITAMVTITRKN